MAELFRGVPGRRKMTLKLAAGENPSFWIGRIPLIPFLPDIISAKYQLGEIQVAEDRRAAAHHFAKVLALRGSVVPRERVPEGVALTHSLQNATAMSREALAAHLRRLARTRVNVIRPFTSHGLSVYEYLRRQHELQGAMRRRIH